MICAPCREASEMVDPLTSIDEVKKALHVECPGGTWCDCQHKTKLRRLIDTGVKVAFNGEDITKYLA